MSVCLIVAIFIFYEAGFDHMHKRNIYRLGEVQINENNLPERIAQSMFPMGASLKVDFPEIKDFTQIISWEKVPLQSDNNPAIMGVLYATNASFLKMFNFKLVSGEPNPALVPK